MNRLCNFLILVFLFTACKKSKDVELPPTLPPRLDTLGTGWSMISLGTTNAVSDVFFINTTTGFALAGNEIYRSISGGDYWQKVYQAGSSLVNIGMGSTTNAVFTSAANKIYSTSNEGTLIDSSDLASYVPDAFFVSPTIVYAIGAKVWKSIDGGKNWNAIFTFTQGGSGGYRSLHFLNEQTGWATTPSGLYKTTDGGMNWDLINTPGFGFSTTGSIFFYDTNTGYLADDVRVGKTINGGTNWNTLYSGVSTYHDLHFLTADIGYLTDGTTIYKTINGGANWTREVKLGELSIVELHFTDTDHGWAGASNGTILKYVK